MAETATAEKVIEMDVIEFDITNMAIEQLKQKYSGMTIEPGNGPEYRAVKEAISDVRSRRISVEKRRKDLKADAIAFGKKVDARAREITELLTPLESELKDIKKVEDDRKEAIKAEKAAIEQARVDKIQGLITELKSHATGLVGKSSDEISDIIDHVENISVVVENDLTFLNSVFVPVNTFTVFFPIHISCIALFITVLIPPNPFTMFYSALNISTHSNTAAFMVGDTLS